MTAAMTKRLIMPVALLLGSPHDWPPSTASLTLGEGEIAPQPAQENNGIAASWLFANDFGVTFGPRARVDLAARENVSARQCYKVGHDHHPTTSKNLPHGRKVRLLAAELGIPLHLVARDPRTGETRSADYLAKNPNGKIPTLKEDGFILWESPAILKYLAAKHPESGLNGKDAKTKASRRSMAVLVDLRTGSICSPTK